MANKGKRVCVSGYFSPVHVGHLEYFQKAKNIAGPNGSLIVIVNNDEQELLKKGKIFMKANERVKIIESLRMVDEVVLSIDKDRTVCKTLEVIKPDIFCNGGDQNNESIPEKDICDRFHIQLIDGLGEKIQSSSWLTGNKAIVR